MFVKRGISPLIATVLIIGFTIALGAVIILWGGGFIRGIQEKSEVSAAKAETCAAALLEATGLDQSSPGTLDFLLENLGSVDVESVVVRVTGDSGIDSSAVGKVARSVKKSFHVNFDPSKVGSVSKVELIPKVSVAGQPEVCANGVEFESERPSDSEIAEWDASCGDGNLDLEWEECDGNIFPENPADGAPLDCASFGYSSGGSLACSSFCTIDVSGCSGSSTCGNGVLDGEEGCELIEGVPDFYGDTIVDCATLSSSLGEPTVWSGSLYCAPDCMIDVSQCSRGEVPDTCGNEFVDIGEECDVDDLAGQTCASQGFESGTLSCNADCTFDTTQCDTCGNGAIDNCEYCDGLDLRGMDCASFGYSFGALGCSSQCNAFDFRSCSYASTCGNMVKESGESCDTSDFGNKTCADFGFVAGSLSCAAGCGTIDTSGCVQFAKVATGAFHTCGVTGAGEVYCWGDNAYGQLGLGDTTDLGSPTKINGLTGVVEVVAGSSHTCALKSDGTVWCWGDDSSGRLGDDATIAQKTAPVQAAIAGVAKIRSGALAAHTCALKSDGTLWCWGFNAEGQIGDNSITNRPTPVQVNVNSIADLALGYYYTCGITSAGDMYCWGDNYYGTYCSNAIESKVPLSIMGGVAKVTSGGYHTCMLKTDNKMYCCGKNSEGQIGNGGVVSPVMVPYQIPLLLNVLQISASPVQSCAVDNAGDMYCWGTGYYYSMGNGGSGGSDAVYIPNRKNMMKNPSSTSFGSYHGCALNSTGSYCWGFNNNGQVGSGSGRIGSPTYDVPSPMRLNISSAGCGNAKLDVGEACETNGQQLNSKNCTSQGFQTGRLRCNSACSLDTNECKYSRIASCGNGAKEQCEECDGADIGGKTCADFGFRFGTPGCSSACGYDLSTCSNCVAGGQSGCAQTSDCCAPFLCVMGRCMLF